MILFYFLFFVAWNKFFQSGVLDFEMCFGKMLSLVLILLFSHLVPQVCKGNWDGKK